MERRVTDNSINFNGKVVNIGIDVHKLSWRIIAMVEGVVVKAVTIKPSNNVLKKVLSQFKGQYSSGERIRMGNITHTGNHRVRTLLVESSWTLIRKDPSLYRVYESTKKRRRLGDVLNLIT